MAQEGKTWLDRLPSYASMLITMGSLIFSIGVIYSDVTKLKVDVQNLSQSAAKTDILSTRMNTIQLDVDRAGQAQGKLDVKLDAINASLGAIQVGVARLESTMAERDKRK